MKYRLRMLFVVAAILAFLLLWSIPSANAQLQPDPAALAARIEEESAKPTPRMPDGHPDMTGYWGELRRDRLTYSLSADGKTLTVLGEADAPDLDGAVQPRSRARRADESSRPPYKPEFIPKWRELMATSSLLDPGIHCYPPGVPRVGAPTEIVQTPTTIYLMYTEEGGAENQDQTNTFRVVPIGGKHDPDRDPRPEGDSIAYWDGDTLVIDVVNLDPETWLHPDGAFHSDALHVVERFTRRGNTLDYDVTISDPKVFTRPWKPVATASAFIRHNNFVGSITRFLGPAGFHAIPAYPCVERDRENKVNYDRP